MKSCRITVLFILMLFLTGSCSRQDDFQEVEYEIFAGSTSEQIISLEETIKKVIDRYGITDEQLGHYRSRLESLYSMNIRYDVHALTYHTETPDGDPVLASGAVFYPRNVKPAGVLEIFPSQQSRETCPTVCPELAEVIPGMIKGYICIVPDLIGAGVTSECPLAYLQWENAAVVCADLRQAAWEFVYNRYHFRMKSESIIFGYSLGAAYALALADLYRAESFRGIRVGHLFCGAGVYDPLEVFGYQAHAQETDFAMIPNILYSLDHYEKMDLDLGKCFKGPLRAEYKAWCDGSVPVEVLTERLGVAPAGYLSEELLAVLDADSGMSGNPLAAVLRKVLQEKSAAGLVPETKVTLAHGSQDNVVPLSETLRLKESLEQAGLKVELKTYDAGHVAAGLQFGKYFYEFLDEL